MLLVGIEVPDIEQCPAKNRVMSDESYFIMDTVVQHEAKKKYKLQTS